MAETFTIKAVKPDPKGWNSAYGPMVTYTVMIEGRDTPVELNKKPDSPVPQAGDELYGDINRTEYGDKFKSAQRPFGGQPSTNSGSSTKGSSGKPSFDTYTMYLSYAKDLAVASIEKGVFNGTTFAELLDAVSAGGAQLYATRPEAPKTETEPTVKKTDDGLIDVTEIDSLFDKEEDSAWQKPSEG